MITVIGLKELQDKLNQLPAEVEFKYMQKALKEGAKEIGAAVVAAAPTKRGILASSIAITQSKTDVGIKAAFYSRFLENGTDGRPVLGGRRARIGFVRSLEKALPGALVGAIKPNHFISKATEGAKNDAFNAIADKLKDQIEQGFSGPA